MAEPISIQVMSSIGPRAAYDELVPVFERISAYSVFTTFPPSVEIVRRVKAGETTDVVILPAGGLDELIGAGHIVPTSRLAFARSGVGIAVRAGSQRPDIGSTAALARALRAAQSLAYSTGPSGVYLADLFQRLGLADELAPKTKQVQGMPVGELIARGEVEIGFQQISELLPISGIDFLGPLPAEIQHVTVFAAGLHRQAKARDAGQALIAFLAAPDAAPAIRKYGMEPA